MANSKSFTDIKIGDKVIVYDTYTHDYIQHTIEITSEETDEDYITETNPTGKHFFGNDLDYGEDEEMYISNVDESNFIDFAD